MLGYRWLSIFDETPVLNTERGEEIRVILAKYRPSKYAILDDDNDMLDYQLKNFFQTDPDYGLTETIAYRVIQHLGFEQGDDEPQWKHGEELRKQHGIEEGPPTVS